MRFGVRRCGTRSAASALLAALTVAGGVPATADAAPSAAPALLAPTTSAALRIVVQNISPFTPLRTTTPQSVTFQLAITNDTSTAVSGLTISAERGEPIGTQSALGPVALAPTDASGSVVGIAPVKPVTVAAIAPGTTVSVAFQTTASILTDSGICECADAVYPILFTASGAGGEVGTGGTYLPVAVDQVDPVRVGWIWPILDRPHRLLSDTVFEDDDLAAEVASGGRLDRALQVLEALDDSEPVTVLFDPETLDELAVMAAGAYQVRRQSGSTGSTDDTGGTAGDGTTTVAGTGTADAGQWLARLHALLSTSTKLTVALTSYGDPDVQSLTAHKLGWRTAMPAAMADRVRRALDGVTPSAQLQWPVGGTASAATITALARSGAKALVLSAASVDTGTSQDQPPPGAVSVSTGSTTVRALLTSDRLQSLVQTSVSLDGSGVSAVPRLLAELAVRVTADPEVGHVAVLAAPRYVDPDVAAAVQTIQATASSLYTTPAVVPALAGLGGVDTAGSADALPRARPATAAGDGGLTDTLLTSVREVTTTLPTLRSLLTRPGTAGGSGSGRTPSSTLSGASASRSPAGSSSAVESGSSDAPGSGRTDGTGTPTDTPGSAGSSPDSSTPPSESVSRSASGSPSASPSAGGSSSAPPTSPTRDSAAQQLLTSLPVGTQRLESAAWKEQDAEATADRLAAELERLTAGVVAGVRLVPPTTGSYTLASGSSALPVTVANDGAYDMYVTVSVGTVGGLPGLNATPLRSREIPANSKVILHLPTSLVRTGRLKVVVTLSAPDGAALGSPVYLTVHSTALGQVGIIVMIAAAVLLVLALVRRWLRTAAARRQPRPPVTTDATES